MPAPRPRDLHAPRRSLASAAASPFLAAVLLVAVAGCGGPTATSAPSPALSTATPGPASAAPLASPVDGHLTKIDAEGLAKVKGFTLLLLDGTEVAFTIGVLENGAQFPPGHLAEHMSTSSPVRVFFRDEGGQRVVYRIEDAPEP